MEPGAALVGTGHMDAEYGRHGAASVAEILMRERPALTFDEIERVDRRLNASCVPRRSLRRRSRLAAAVCLTLGLSFTTAGTGLAISGFSTPGGADHAQYPDRPAGGHSKPARGTGSGVVRPPAPPKGPAVLTPGRPGVHPKPKPSTLREIPTTGRAPMAEVTLRQAETRDNPPFTGLGAIPILVCGIGLIVEGVVLNRRRRLI